MTTEDHVEVTEKYYHDDGTSTSDIDTHKLINNLKLCITIYIIHAVLMS